MTSRFGRKLASIRFAGIRANPSGPTASRSRRLDGIRGLAAIGVLIYHCAFFTGFWSWLYWRSHTAGTFVANAANFCVAVFFALSGFLLFREYLGKILFDEDPPRTAPYFARRFLRIYPAYWVALLAFVVLIGANQLRGSAFGLITLTERNLNRTEDFPGMRITWTLFIEVAFYVLLPVAAAVLVRLCRWKPLAIRIRIVIAFLGGLAVFSMLWVFLVDHFANSDVRLVQSLPSYLVWFAAGMALAVLHRSHQRGFPIAPRISRLAQHPWRCWVGALVLNLGFARMKSPPSISENAPQMQIRLAVLAIAAFLVILPLVLPSQPSKIHVVVGSRLLAWVGIVSYGVYLWQVVVIAKLTELHTFGRTLAGSLILLALVLPISLALGWVSFRMIERPAMSLAPNRVSKSAN